MRWFKVTVQTAPEAEEAVAALLRDAGAEGVMLEDGSEGDRLVIGFLPESRAAEAANFTSRVQGLTEYGLAIGAGLVTSEWITDDDWAEKWKQDYKPIALGQRLLIKPAWLPAPPGAAERIVIELDPGMAFGTGYHPTTALCLEALDELVESGATVADIGTGSGILAIAAARLGAGRVVAVDTLAEAVPVAEENCRLNGVGDVVAVAQGSADEALVLLRKADARSATADAPDGEDIIRADVLVVNILARVIRRLAPDLARLLRPGGTFIFSGIIEHAAEELIHHLREHGLDVTEERTEGEWSCLIGHRRD